LLRLATPSLTQTNRVFHRMLRDGVPVEYPRPDASIAGDHVRLVDFSDLRANEPRVSISMACHFDLLNVMSKNTQHIE